MVDNLTRRDHYTRGGLAGESGRVPVLQSVNVHTQFNPVVPSFLVIHVVSYLPNCH